MQALLESLIKVRKARGWLRLTKCFSNILLSPKLFEQVTAGGVMRQGMWPGSRPKRWETYDDLDDPKHAASDHAALWVDLDI